ncbi:MAG: D-inositol-3-phosphate glycosyltransferase [Nocardioidaceae bacterium]|nr:D-inositol-3-phosphate glycosyltransferase [Nocardioidaceae bacterium]
MSRGTQRAGAIRRVAMLSVHTSPLDQLGTGDAGGMNVYVLELARRLAALGVETEVFTRATSSRLPPVVHCEPGVSVRHVAAGPFEGLSKEDLPAQLCPFVREVLRVEAAHSPNRYDVIHSHYWLSGQVGAVVRDLWGVPLVHTMHTTAKVKNGSLARGDTPEPWARVVGEEQVVEAADQLIANTAEEVRQLVDLYGADPARIEVVHPGVDLRIFSPQPTRAARATLGLSERGHVLLFAGRLQPMKAPDVLLRAVAVLLDASPQLRNELQVAVVGGLSGSGLQRPHALQKLAAGLGVGDVVRFVPAVSQPELALWYAAASLVCVPSYSESFGLVALEAQACGTPVVAAAVGGLTTAVRDGVTGVLVPGHDPARYASVVADLLANPRRRELMGQRAVTHAASFGWDQTAARTLQVYRAAVGSLGADRLAAS